MRKNAIINNLLLIILLFITVRYLIAGWNRILLNANSADGDQAAYLQLGLDAREHGTITDGKRNPLYPLVLSTFAQREWAYFTWAKIFNFIVGLITIWVVFFIGKFLFNPIVGVLAAFLLSINFEFIAHTTFALAEALLFLSFLLAWFFMVKALQRPEIFWFWFLAGVFTGLAYMAKGTGPLIAVCFVTTATLLYRLKIWFTWTFWGFILGFCLMASPLWLYNWATFGSPLFNSAVNNIMWMDDATQKYVADTSTLPTFASYIQNNSIAEIWARLTDGLLIMRYFYAKLLWPTRSLLFDDLFQRGWIDIGFITLVVLFIVFWRPLRSVLKRHRESLLLTTIMVALFYLLFGWYIAIAPFPIRFILPLAPMLFLLLSAAVVGLLVRLFTAPQVPRWTKTMAASFTLFATLAALTWSALTGYFIANAAQQNAFAIDAEYNNFTEQALRWVRAGHEGANPVNVMWGPTHDLPMWRHSDQLNSIRTPVAEASDADDLAAFMAASNVTYVIVNGDMVDRMGENNAADWGIRRRDDDRIEFDHYPSDWALGFLGPKQPCRWCVFRRLTATPVITQTEYDFDNAIVLFGYEVETTTFEPGGQITVTLYWISLQPVSTDYTVFTQLLGPDYQLHGQMDRQPLAGHWPTSRWQPQQKFVDKFTLHINQTLPSGSYTLLVGLYDESSGQRLPVTDHNQPLYEDAIPLVELMYPHFETEVQGTR